MYEIVQELKMIFYEASEKLCKCKMEDNSFVSEHVLKMSGHADKLQERGITIPNDLGFHLVLQSLSPSYNKFVMNYNMQCMKNTISKLL
jgi:hypothetical protein